MGLSRGPDGCVFVAGLVPVTCTIGKESCVCVAFPDTIPENALEELCLTLTKGE